jgi:hypothetical protein
VIAANAPGWQVFWGVVTVAAFIGLVVVAAWWVRQRSRQ